MGKCVDCGGSTHPCAVYIWTGKPSLRDALCPVHRTSLARTTEGRLGRRKIVRAKPLSAMRERTIKIDAVAAGLLRCSYCEVLLTSGTERRTLSDRPICSSCADPLQRPRRS